MPTLEVMLDVLAEQMARDGEGCCPLCDGQMVAGRGRLAGILRCGGCGAELEASVGAAGGRRAA